MLSLFMHYTHSFRRFFGSQKGFEIYKILQKYNLQEMLVISLSSCSLFNANFKFDQSVFTIHDSYFADLKMTFHKKFFLQDWFTNKLRVE